MGLLEKAGTTTPLIQRLSLITMTVFKSLHGLNPPCLNDMFTPEYVAYQIRDSSLSEESRCRTITYQLTHFLMMIVRIPPLDLIIIIKSEV